MTEAEPLLRDELLGHGLLGKGAGAEAGLLGDEAGVRRGALVRRSERRRHAGWGANRAPGARRRTLLCRRFDTPLPKRSSQQGVCRWGPVAELDSPELPVRLRPANERSGTFQLLFVCTGNICRSPTAELLLTERLRWDSAATPGGSKSTAPGPAPWVTKNWTRLSSSCCMNGGSAI